MNDTANQEYDESLAALLEAVWGEGFMSPGGTDEVDRYLDGIDLGGLEVLDIGCGLGGVDIHIVKRHAAAKVTGIDVEEDLIERCQLLADKYALGGQTEFVTDRTDRRDGRLPHKRIVVPGCELSESGCGGSRVAVSLAARPRSHLHDGGLGVVE